MSSLAKVPKYPAWVWTCTIVLPLLVIVWEGADAHLLAVYGFSIIEIIKDNLNPKEKTIQFGGIKS